MPSSSKLLRGRLRKRIMPLGAASLAVLGTLSAVRADPRCNEQKPAPGTAGYQWRVDRCEGYYLPKAGVSVIPYSFTFGKIELGKGDQVHLRWAKVAKAKLNLLVRPSDPAIPYQMTTTIDPDRPEYAWPRTLLDANRIGSLAVLARTDDQTYVPAYAREGASEYELIFYSSDILGHVVVTVADDEDDEVFRFGPSDAKTKLITVDIPASKLATSRRFEATLVAESNAGSVSSSLAFRTR